MTTLSDVDIEARISAGNLIKGGDKAQIGPACYELRMGAVYYDLTEDDARIECSATKKILIKPGHRVVLITEEALEIPSDVIARVTSKGSLFSIGLSPVSTYADPGFTGNLGIVTQNMSDKYIEIPVGEPIAKVDFSLLSTAVKRPYQGQHGFQTKIWPIKHQLQKSFQDVRDDPRVESEVEEAYKILPPATASVLRRLQKKQRVIDGAIVISLLLNTMFIAGISPKYFDPLVSVATNLISTGIVAVLVLWSNLKR